ncbi:hypothetical protein KZ773_11025 [Escherichia coli]|nr:hypothetical protein [Escherichia coli]
MIGASRKETPKPRRRAFSGLQNIRGRYHQWMNELPERVSHKTQHLDEKKRARSFECRGAAVDPRYHRHLLADSGVNLRYSAV